MSNIIPFESEGDLMPENHRTDQEYIQAGETLVKKAETTARELGEWFNDLKLNKSDANKLRGQANSEVHYNAPRNLLDP